MDDPDGKRFLSIIQSSSTFMLFLVNDLLDFFQIKNGKFRKNPKWVDFRLSVLELLDMFRVGTDSKGLALDFECESSFPDKIYIDE